MQLYVTQLIHRSWLIIKILSHAVYCMFLCRISCMVRVADHAFQYNDKGNLLTYIRSIANTTLKALFTQCLEVIRQSQGKKTEINRIVPKSALCEHSIICYCADHIWGNFPWLRGHPLTHICRMHSPSTVIWLFTLFLCCDIILYNNRTWEPAIPNRLPQACGH